MKSIGTILAILAIICLGTANAGDRLAKLDGLDFTPRSAAASSDRSLLSNWASYLRGEIPTRKSMALHYGLSYDPNNDNDMLLTSFQWTCKYEDFWVHDAPDNAMFRFELVAGARLMREERLILAGSIFAQFYLTGLSSDTFKPYIDGGIGVIYTDFKNKDQGLRVNFFPQLTVGTDIKVGTSTYFAAIRAYHQSNAGLHHENRGVNGAMILFGRYF